MTAKKISVSLTPETLAAIDDRAENRSGEIESIVTNFLSLVNIGQTLAAELGEDVVDDIVISLTSAGIVSASSACCIFEDDFVQIVTTGARVAGYTAERVNELKRISKKLSYVCRIALADMAAKRCAG